MVSQPVDFKFELECIEIAIKILDEIAKIEFKTSADEDRL